MPDDYKDFITRINRKLGIDLSLYKEAQMKRRLTSLRNKRGFEDFSEYFLSLESNEELLSEFIDRLTINVSEFYRNPKRWDVLKNVVLPFFLEKKDRISIWSAACSTGEEPYSLAIMINEHFPDASFRLVATDIDETALKKAKAGIYQEQALKELPEHLKTKYFIKENGLYHIKSQLKQVVAFKEHNLLSDRYPENMDLIICRNVLIYFTDKAKEFIYQNFSKSLTEKGVLFVGSTEQIFNPDTYNFSLLDTFFYQKK